MRSPDYSLGYPLYESLTNRINANVPARDWYCDIREAAAYYTKFNSPKYGVIQLTLDALNCASVGGTMATATRPRYGVYLRNLSSPDNHLTTFSTEAEAVARAEEYAKAYQHNEYVVKADITISKAIKPVTTTRL